MKKDKSSFIKYFLVIILSMFIFNFFEDIFQIFGYINRTILFGVIYLILYIVLFVIFSDK